MEEEVFFLIVSAIFALVITAGVCRYDFVANVLFVAQAVLSFLVWKLFAFGAFSLAVMLHVHHIIIHWDTDFSDQITFMTLQLRDVSNHETWIVASLVAALIFLIYPSMQ